MRNPPKLVIAYATALLVLALQGCSYMPMSVSSWIDAPPKDQGWVTLLDGSNLNNWSSIGNANWRLYDGNVQAEIGAGYLISKQSYKDFQIKAEFWADEEANSGIFIRLSDPKTVTADNSYEVNIFDKRPDPSYGTGAIVNVSKISPMPKVANKWNTYEITAKGAQLTVILNGVVTADVADSKFASGPIALQSAGGVIKFRRVWIKAL
jgi:Domain of Unknown Function (DUF1080)